MADGGELVRRDVICVGASSGGVAALVKFVAELPLDIPASVFIVLHTAPGSPGALASILDRSSAWPVAMAVTGETIEPGRIRVAPPDHHLLLVDGKTVIDRGPRENRVRPAVDTLFRSAAVCCGARVIGVVLTGQLNDGAAGARAIKRAGGTLIVQSPEDAESPSMPRSAIAAQPPDHVVPLAEMGALLGRLVGSSTPRSPVPDDIALEVEAGMRLGEVSVQINDRVGRAAPFTCPDCGGPLWRLEDPPRFRCQLGHAMTMDILDAAKGQASVQALWVAARTLDERARLLGDMARDLRRAERVLSANAYEASAAEVRGAAMEIRRLLGRLEDPEP